MPIPQPLPRALSVSVVVPVCDGGPDFGHVLEALSRLSPAPLELIVVEDGPQRDQYVYPHGVRVLRLASRRGPAAARNAGARTAEGDLLLFLDADVVAPPDLAGRVQEAFCDPDVDAVFGSYDRSPAAPGLCSQFKNLVHRFVHQHAREEAQTFWSACGAIRRQVFETLGGFDERFTRPSVEDIELGMRLTRAGGRIRLVKQLEVTHLKRWTLPTLLYTDIFCRAVPWSRLLVAASSLPDDLNLTRRARLATTLLAVALLAVLFSPLKPSLLAVAAVSAGVVWVLDWTLWRYFASERGWGFAVRCIPLQWAYYLYSGAAFVWVFAVERRAAAQPEPQRQRGSLAND
jgi:cellulose synthase/poly-beta-1,6-N-acetylglucosamine synthase-like glycosyltransferase